jgi:hypothetical protein
MMAVDDTTEAICKLLKSAFEYVDTLICNKGGECQTFTMSIHCGGDDVYPSKCLTAFIAQVRAAIKPTDLVYCLEIHGPISVEQNCFLNRRLHKHYAWDVTIQLASTKID